MTSAVIPALTDIQTELEEDDIHAEVTHTPSTRAHSLGSSAVHFGGVALRKGGP